MPKILPKKIRLINIPDSAYINRLDQIKKAYAELLYILALFDKKEKDRCLIPMKILFCEDTGEFFRLYGEYEEIVIERLPINETGFKQMYNLYYRYFVSFDPINYRSFEPGEIDQFREAWSTLFDFFLVPVEEYFERRIGVNVIISIGQVKDQAYILDLGTIYDLKFYFRPAEKNVVNYVLSVAGLSLVEFVQNLLQLTKPSYCNTVLLYGFKEHYSSKSIASSTHEIRSMALAREAVYQEILSAAKLVGLVVADLDDVEELLNYFKKDWQGYTIQILAHYENSIPGRLYFRKKSVRFDILIKLIQELKLKSELRSDILLDAVTCTNFFDFHVLYSFGFRYLNLTLHEIDTDQSAFILYELYTGTNAKKIGWDPNYLNGENFLHEAKSNVKRCFFSICRGGDFVVTP